MALQKSVAWYKKQNNRGLFVKTQFENNVYLK